MAKGKGGFIGHDGLNAPDSPTGVSGASANESAVVSFTAPTNTGGSDITGYVVTANDGTGATGSSSPITVTGLTNGTAYTFNVWAINTFGYSEPSAATGSVTPAIPDRAIAAGGDNAVGTLIDYFDFSSGGNASDFGDLTETRSSTPAGIGGSTRGIIAGAGSTNSRSIDYITIASTGNAQDFGDLLDRLSTDNTSNRTELGGFGNSTRGIVVGSAPLSGNGSFEYLTIATLGNTVDFGDHTRGDAMNQAGGAGSTTRGLMGAFQSDDDLIEYITYASTGNATSFGNLTDGEKAAVSSSSTRAIWMGGGFNTNDTIQYLTIASTGNGTDFGDLTQGRQICAGASNSTISVCMGGSKASNVRVNTIDQVTIATTGNATDYGDLTASRRGIAGLSNCHGGL